VHSFSRYEVTTLLIGLAVGLVGRFVIPGRRPINVLLALALGAIGAYAAMHFGIQFGLFKAAETGGYIIILAGAVIPLVLYAALFRSTT
jgi:uncharacterized membrane protein YeaQ/YmgE (transglycosylase-associated protein family)